MHNRSSKLFSGARTLDQSEGQLNFKVITREAKIYKGSKAQLNKEQHQYQKAKDTYVVQPEYNVMLFDEIKSPTMTLPGTKHRKLNELQDDNRDLEPIL